MMKKILIKLGLRMKQDSIFRFVVNSPNILLLKPINLLFI